MDKKRAFEIVKEYINFLKEKKYNIQMAYIFGSYAKDNFCDDSDIDLAIIMKGLKNGFEEQIKLMKFRRKFDTRIEPHPFDEKDFDISHPLVNEILKTGIKVL